MKRLESIAQGFVQYGISSDLATRAVKCGLTVTKVRALSLKNMQEQFSLTSEEAKELKDAVRREPIDEENLHSLLERSNYTCNICHGTKGLAFIIHHIVPYAKTQDNSYVNLIVLCPNDHDLAHGSGLTMSISETGLLRAKEKWESLVEKANAARAAKAVEINDGAIDYINVRRIEELCLHCFGKIPPTRATASLRAKGILDECGTFQQEFVRRHLSGGAYLFDYINSGEALHYRDLMAQIAREVVFEDLTAAVERGKKAVVMLEDHYAFFIGGVFSKRPEIPVTVDTPAVLMHYTKRNIRIEWILDPNFLLSSSAISRQGSKNRYIIYCLVRTVDDDTTPGKVLVKASPLLIAQPSIYPNRIPAVHWEHKYSDLIDEEPDILEEPGQPPF